MSFPFQEPSLLILIHEYFSNFATVPLPFLPISGFTAVHSLRIAYLYHSVLHSQGIRVGNRSEDVSYLQAALVCTTLVMSGTTMAAILQGQPSSLLMDQGSGHLVAAYMAAGVAMKWLHPSILQLPQTPLKALCFLIDGFATTFGTLSLGLQPVLQNPHMSSSSGGPLALPTLILPLLCGSGAALLVPFFGLFQPKFSFRHPGFLSERLSVDIWGTWLITALYGTIADGRGSIFGNIRTLLAMLGFGVKAGMPQDGPWMRAEEAHVLCSLVLSAIYVINDFGPEIFLKPLSASGSALKSRSEKPEHDASSHATSTARQSSVHALLKRQARMQG